LDNKKKGPGRPSKYKDKAEQMRAQRAKMKEAGYKDIHASIPGEFKDLLDGFCVTTGLTISEMICYLLGCAADQDVAEVDKSLKG
jgi:hypothetical protein